MRSQRTTPLGVNNTTEAELRYCTACGGPDGHIHVTVDVRLVSERSARSKIAQFWLCDNCDRKMRELFVQQYGREGKVARALTPWPAHWTPREGEQVQPIGAD